MHGTNGIGSRRRGRNGEAFGLSINFGPLGSGLASTCAWRKKQLSRPFRASRRRSEKAPAVSPLTLIARNPGISQTVLSLANGRDKSSLTPVVEDLVRRGLVERKRMDSDRRTYSLNLTPAGKKVLTTLTRCARRHERHLDQVIGARDRKRFIQILKKIAAEIE